MARRTSLPFKDIQLTVVGPKGAALASRVQRLDVQANFPSSDIDELGDDLHAGVTTDPAEITVTFQAMDVSTNIFAALTGNIAYPAAGVETTALQDIDVVGRVRDAVSPTVIKSFSGKKLRITGFNYQYSVTGDSTEEYTAIGTEKRWFRNDVVIDKFSTGTTTFTLTTSPKVLKNGHYAVSAILDGAYLTEVTGTPATGEYRIVGTTLTTGDSMTSQLVVVYQATTATGAYAYLRDNSIPAAIRGKNVPVTIYANGISRVQSVSMRGEFPNNAIREMGNVDLVGYSTQVPRVTGDISVLDTDLDLVSLFTKGALSTQTGDTEFASSEYTFQASGVSLKIELKDPADNTTVKKTLYIPKVIITTEGHTSQVGNDTTQTFAWKSFYGNIVIYSGAMP